MSFAAIGPSLWDVLPSSLHLAILFSSFQVSISLLKTSFYSWVSGTGGSSEWALLFVALYKFRNTKQDNIILHRSMFEFVFEAVLLMNCIVELFLFCLHRSSVQRFRKAGRQRTDRVGGGLPRYPG